MDKSVTIVYPTQLFENSPAVRSNRPVMLVEDTRYFTDFAVHKKKLVLLRASMQAYQNYLVNCGYHATYIEYQDAPLLFAHLIKNGIFEIHVVDPCDDALYKRLQQETTKLGLHLIFYETPQFLTPSTLVMQVMGHTAEHYSAQSFYINQRKRLNILINRVGGPVGGKWSFDSQNRQKIPQGHTLPDLWIPPTTNYVRNAIVYVEKNFADNPGLAEPFFYPVTHTHARQWFDDFLAYRFANFGPYEDAMIKTEPFLYHSVLALTLNTGLLTPDYIINRALDYVQRHQKQIPFNSLEGFIRQIIGWREYMRAVYLVHGQTLLQSNFFNHTRALPKSFWNAQTCLEPVDTVIARVKLLAYAHHIERLMVMGNIMLLCEINPMDVYRWFMELFIDAYEWVMVPNVLGMSQYADGGTIITKPYISSSAYILRMSDYKKGEWSNIWDSLFWHFIYKKRDIIGTMPRLRIMILYLSRLKKQTLMEHLTRADQYLDSLD